MQHMICTYLINSSADEAERIYNCVAKCLNCDHAGEMACLRTKSMDEIYNCTWTTEVRVENFKKYFKEITKKYFNSKYFLRLII